MSARTPFHESGYSYGEGPGGRRICRGAMMGRPGVGEANRDALAPCVSRVRLREGYDPGGAYWGERPAGVALYCFWTHDRRVVRFLDAPTLPAALAAFRADFPGAGLA